MTTFTPYGKAIPEGKKLPPKNLARMMAKGHRTAGPPGSDREQLREAVVQVTHHLVIEAVPAASRSAISTWPAAPSTRPAGVLTNCPPRRSPARPRTTCSACSGWPAH
ncbi:MAG TPA: hypothetical protein VGP31_17170 [Planosporangium sp.]|nr:hypothetical protein [Planosporangium sp.]